LKHAFNVFTFGEDTMQRLGFGRRLHVVRLQPAPALGFTQKQITEANDHICGRQTIEGAPHIADEHLSVFDTANKNGKYGRAVHPPHRPHQDDGRGPAVHLGAISKTINMPNESDHRGHRGGLPALLGARPQGDGLYRDGSKAAQPLNSTSDEGEDNEDEDAAITAAVETEKAIHWGNLPAGISPTQAYARG
jgi:ribonucleoside-diphosphate reductase alpha chain